ncbi:glycosyl hydrolase family 18 protein [Brevibacillus sp. H7]|uniref:glycosyl hydrolase family 18 protein n=1 Tax=Brevibacillus sp. H7 TaxID=3349138 RepID=UPI003821365B
MSLPLGMSPRPKRKHKLFTSLKVAVIATAVGVAAACAWFALQLPSTERVAPYDGRKDVIVFQGEAYAASYRLEEEQLMLPFDFIKEHVDPILFWDEPSRSVIVTTKDKVLRMESDQLVAYLNKRPVDLRVPVKDVNGVRYLPVAPLEKLYPLVLTHKKESGVLLVEKAGYAVQQGKVAIPGEEKNPQPQFVRTGNSAKKPIVAELQPGSVVDILGEDAGWYRVLTDDGIAGFLPKEAVVLTDIRQVILPQPSQQTTAWKPIGAKVNLVWEHVVNRNPNLSDIGTMPGVNVVSPTWFELKDDQATLENKADPAYVQWAHKRGYQVWGLVSNGFHPDWTKAVLGSYQLREKLIAQILHYARLYDLDGINLDFENVYLDDKERLVQFVRELTPFLHEQGLTVSMDVTIKSSSDRWSRFYDRAALAQVVDYIAVMTYDEHWATSPKAGSVASLPWTEQGLKGVLEEVPNKKLLLGVPFYTRLWKEEKQPDGSVKVTSKALSMMRAEEWVKQRNLTPQPDAASGQLFVSYNDPTDRAVYKMWLEDETSMQKRMALVKKYNLAGVAAWRRGFEQAEIWSAIESGLNTK